MPAQAGLTSQARAWKTGFYNAAMTCPSFSNTITHKREEMGRRTLLLDQSSTKAEKEARVDLASWQSTNAKVLGVPVGLR